MKNKGDDEDDKKEESRKEVVVESLPEPPAPEVVVDEPTLEERVEVLEGQVQPRTGA